MIDKHIHQIDKYIESKNNLSEGYVNALNEVLKRTEDSIAEANQRIQTATRDKDTASCIKAKDDLEKANSRKSKILKTLKKRQEDPLVSDEEYKDIVMDVIEYTCDACDEDLYDVICQLKKIEAIGEVYRQRIAEADQVLRRIQMDLYRDKNGSVIEINTTGRDRMCAVPDLIDHLIAQAKENRYVNDAWSNVRPSLPHGHHVE